MAVKGYSTFPKAPALLDPHHQIVEYHILLEKSYSSAEMQLVYSVAPADLTTECPGYDTKQSDGEASALNSVEYPFIAIAP